MKEKIFILLVLVLQSCLVSAQLVKKVTSKVKSTVENRAMNRSVEETEKVLDRIEGKEQEKKTNTVPKDAVTGRIGSDSSLAPYLTYDFIAGEQIIYSNDFSTDLIGEMPAGWNSNGTAAVSTINGVKGKWIKLHQNSFYLTDNKDSLTENFTVEFDLVMYQANTKAAFPMVAFGVLASGTYAPGANELLKNYAGAFTTELKIQPYQKSGSYMHLQTFVERSKYLVTDIKKWDDLSQFINQKIHVAMQVQSERLRIWFNEKKLYDLPKAIAKGHAINQLYVDVKRYGGPDDEVGYAISNIKIAKGIPDSRHRLIEEGKFSTTGILFDVNTATLKPESLGVLNEIGEVLRSNQTLRLRITGHTDSDGGDAENLSLSKKRAEAVKQALVKMYGIDPGRLVPDGKGETEPVQDNATAKGKAQNRRVEFVKL